MSTTVPYKKLATAIMFDNIPFNIITQEDKTNASLTLRGYSGNMVKSVAGKLLAIAKQYKKIGITLSYKEKHYIRLAGQSLRNI